MLVSNFRKVEVFDLIRLRLHLQSAPQIFTFRLTVPFQECKTGILMGSFEVLFSKVEIVRYVQANICEKKWAGFLKHVWRHFGCEEEGKKICWDISLVSGYLL